MGEMLLPLPVPFILIESSSFLQATWTHNNSQMGSKSGQIGPWTVVLATLEHLENLCRLIMEAML